jgi:hypothetical protein
MPEEDSQGDSWAGELWWTLAGELHITSTNPENETGKQVRRKHHGKETLEEGEEVGSDQAVDGIAAHQALIALERR